MLAPLARGSDALECVQNRTQFRVMKKVLIGVSGALILECFLRGGTMRIVAFIPIYNIHNRITHNQPNHAAGINTSPPRHRAQMAKRKDPGGTGGPRGLGGTGEPDPEIASIVQLWSCDTHEPVEFYVHHAWLLLRTLLGFDPLDFDEGNQAMLFLMDKGEDSRKARTMPVESACTVDVLILLRDYVSAYLDPDGTFKTSNLVDDLPRGHWNFYDRASRATGDAMLAGVQCWKLLQADVFLNLDVWPSKDETGRQRHANGDQPTHAHSQGNDGFPEWVYLYHKMTPAPNFLRF